MILGGVREGWSGPPDGRVAGGWLLRSLAIITPFNDPSREAGKEVGAVTHARTVKEEAANSRRIPRTVLDAGAVSRTLSRIAHELLERNEGGADLMLLGIQTRGVHLAQRLALRMERVTGAPVAVGGLDVSRYRDDRGPRAGRGPEDAGGQVPGGVDGRVVVLVDDVLFSGRTIRAALDAVTDLGRPKAVRLAVLIDRGHRELPIRADSVGKNMPTSLRERVQVRLAEVDGVDEVTIASDP